MSAREQRMVPHADVRTYYDRPVLKEPVWKWPIPAYLFSGGLAAASSMLAVGGRAVGDDRLARRSAVLAAASIAASAAFLIDDLGRPKRFANMLRVLRPTSPMSVGSWLLAAYGPAAGIAAASDVLGIAPATGRTAERVAAALAPAVATYTAVLVTDTAIPAWHEGGREMPLVFAGGALASGGAAAMLHTPGAATRAPQRLAVGGAVTELVALEVMERRLGETARSYHHGRAGQLGRAARATLIGGALAALAPGDRRTSRAARAVGAALVVTGSALERFAVVAAGHESARDPRQVVGPQRARLDAAASNGSG